MHWLQKHRLHLLLSRVDACWTGSECLRYCQVPSCTGSQQQRLFSRPCQSLRLIMLPLEHCAMHVITANLIAAT